MVSNPLLYRHHPGQFLVGLLAAAATQAATMRYLLEMPLRPSLIDPTVSWLVAGLIVFFISHILRYHLPKSNKALKAAFASAILTFLAYSAISSVLTTLLPDPGYAHFFESSRYTRIALIFLVVLGATFVCLLWYQLGERQDEDRRHEEMEKLARDAELLHLRQQLQPHFLFNSLNSINSLIGKRPEEARKMIQQLSEFLRGTLRNDDQKLIPLREELTLLRRYLEIEEVRFGHRLRVKIDCEEALTEWLIPPLLLQPVMENAIKFGLYGTVGEIDIHMLCHEAENYLHLHFSNPFDADAGAQQGAGFGLSSLQRRLYLIFGRADLLATRAENQTFHVHLKIPETHDQSPAN